MTDAFSKWTSGTTVDEPQTVPLPGGAFSKWNPVPDAQPSIRDSIGLNPDEEAKNRRLSQETGLPLPAVEADPREIEKLVKRQQIDNLVKDAPITREWLANPDNAAVAHDSVDNLVLLEGIWNLHKKTGKAIYEGSGAVAAGAFEVLPGISRTITAVAENLGFDEFAAGQRQATSEMEYIQDIIRGDQTTINPLVSKSLESAGLSIAALLTRNPAKAIATVGAIAGGQSYEAGIEAGLTPGRAAVYGGIDAAIEMGTEMIPFQKMFKSLKIGDTVLQSLMKQMIAEVPGEQTATLLQDANQWLTLHPDKTLGEFLEERPNAAFETLLQTVIGTTFTTTVAQGSVNLAQKWKDSRAAKQFNETLIQSQEALTQSPLGPRMPEAQADHLAKAMKAGGANQVYLDVEGINEAANKLEMSPVDLAQQLGMRAEYEREYLRGGDIAVSAERLAQLMQSEQWQALSPHIRQSQTSMTMKEAEEWEKTGAKEAIESALNVTEEPGVDEIMGWHGSPHEFDAFKIEGTSRTGEGNASFGEGLYIGEAEGTGRYYKELAARDFDFNNMPPELEAKYGKRLDELNKELDAIHKKYPSPVESGVDLTDQQFEEYTKLSTAVWNERTAIQEKILKEVREKTGFLYRVKFKAKETELLNWDKKLEDQPIQVLSAIESAYRDAQKEINSDPSQGRSYDLTVDMDLSRTGEQFINEMHVMVGSNKTTELLKKYGLVGTRFLDHDSRIRYQAVTKSDETLEDYKSSIQANQENIDGAKNGIIFAKEDLEAGRITQEVYDDHVQDMEDRIKRSEKNIKSFENKIKNHDKEIEKVRQSIIDKPLTHNYVVFDANRLTILKRNNIPITQAEIDVNAVENEIAVDGMFQTSEEAGWTAEEYMFYLAQQNRAREAAVNKQNEKLLKDAHRKVSKEYKKLRKDMKESVRESLSNSPVYQAINSIQKDRLDRDAVAVLLGGEKFLKDLPKQSKGRAIYTDKGETGGLDPSIVAEMHGFPSATDMMLALLIAKPFDVAVEETTDNMMKRQYPDLTDEKLRLEAALESIHNDHYGEVLTMELNRLREMKAIEQAEKEAKPKKEPTELTPEQKAERAEKLKAATKVRSIKLKVLKAAVKEQLDKTPLKEIRAQRFTSNASKFGKQAGSLIRKGDIDAAIDVKFKQIVNFLMAQQAYKVKARLEKENKYLNKFNGKTPPKIGNSFVQQVRQVLSDFNLGPKLSQAEFITDPITKEKKPSPRKRMMDWVKKQEAEGAIFDIPPALLADQKKHWQDLTVEQWEGVVNAVKNIEAQGRNKLKAGKLHGEVEWAHEKSVLLEQASKLPDTPRTQRSVISKVETLRNKAAARLASIDAAIVKLPSLLRELDGGQAVGPWWESIYKRYNKAQHEELDMLNKHIEPVLIEAFNKLPEKIRKRMNKPVFVKSLGIELTYSQLLRMALDMGNKSNIKKRLDSHNLHEKGKQWTYQDLVDAMGLLSSEEGRWVQKAWDTIEGFRPAVERVFEAEMGRMADSIKPNSIVIGGVKVKGGYFPIQYVKPPIATTPLEAMQDPMIRSSIFSGMTKERKDFSAPMSLDLNGLLLAFEQQIHFITHYEAVRDVNKILTDPDLTRLIEEKLGPEYLEEMKNWHSAVAAGGVAKKNMHGFDKAAEIVRMGTTPAILGANILTVGSQVLGASSAIHMMGKHPKTGRFSAWRGGSTFASGVRKFIKSPHETIEDAMRLSGELRHRVNNIDRDMKDKLNQLKGKTDLKSRWNRLAMKPIMYMQLFAVDIPSWVGAYHRALKDGMTVDKAIDYAEDIVISSQGSGHTKDLSAFQRDPGVAKFLTMFSTWPFIQYNLQRDIYKTAKKFPVDAFSMLIITAMIPAVLNAWMRGNLGPDEEDEDDGWGKWLVKVLLGYNAGSLPIGGSAVASVSEGYDFRLSAVESIPGAIERGLLTIAKIFDSEEELDYKDISNIVTAAGLGTGTAGSVPIRRILDTLDKAEEEDVSWWEYLTGPKD